MAGLPVPNTVKRYTASPKGLSSLNQMSLGGVFCGMLCWTAQGGYGRLAVCGVADVTLDIEKAPLEVPLVQAAEIAGVSGSDVLASRLGVASEGFSLHCCAEAMKELNSNAAKAIARVPRKVIDPNEKPMRELKLVWACVALKAGRCLCGTTPELSGTKPRREGSESGSMVRALERKRLRERLQC